jgi:hypothetical protein
VRGVLGHRPRRHRAPLRARLLPPLHRGLGKPEREPVPLSSVPRPDNQNGDGVRLALQQVNTRLLVPLSEVALHRSARSPPRAPAVRCVAPARRPAATRGFPN